MTLIIDWILMNTVSSRCCEVITYTDVSVIRCRSGIARTTSRLCCNSSCREQSQLPCRSETTTDPCVCWSLTVLRRAGERETAGSARANIVRGRQPGAGGVGAAALHRLPAGWQVAAAAAWRSRRHRPPARHQARCGFSQNSSLRASARRPRRGACCRRLMWLCWCHPKL